MKNVWFVGIFALATTIGFAQNPCGQHILERDLRQNSSQVDSAFQQFDAQIPAWSEQSNQREDLLVIPVVFHVLHQNGEENISDEQIFDAIRIINEDFNARNFELDEVIPEFEGIIGNGEIEFRLAQFDPGGSGTNGIDRIQSSETSVGDDGSKLNNWPRNRYLNIWTADVVSIAGAAAYAYRPPAVANNPNIDGIMCNHRYVGSIGTGSLGGSSHTLSHEIGHYLGLPHPWGGTNEPELQSNCGIDDGITDTPNTIGTSGSCPLDQESCSSLDNVQNFMDYATCESMFTQGQINTMRNVLNSSTAQRNQLVLSGNLADAGVDYLYEADFSTNEQVSCLGNTVQLYDISRNGADSWSWEIEGPMTVMSTDQHPVVNLIPGAYDVTLTVTQGGASEFIKKPAFLVVANDFGEALPFSEDFETYNDDNQVWGIHNAFNDDHTWAPYEGSGTLGSVSFKMSNFNNPATNTRDELLMGAIDTRMVSNLNISFKGAFSQVSASNTDELGIEISSDCGQTWRSVYSRSSSQLAGSTANVLSGFSPTSSDWENFEVTNIPGIWLGETTFIKFIFYSGGGNHFYLDDINIAGDFVDVPQLVFPANNAENMVSDVTLDWRAAPGSSEYEYQLDVTSDFNSSELQNGTMTATGNASDGSDTEFPTTGLTVNEQYFWRVRADGGTWSDTWSFTVAPDGLGVDESSLDKRVIIYPNPSNNTLFVRLAGSEGNTSLEVVDLAGRKVQPQQSSQANDLFTIDTTELPAGWYVLKISQNGDTAYKQFAVSH